MHVETIIPKAENIKIKVPKNMVNQEIDIYIIPKKRKKINFKKFFGVMNVENIDEEIEKMRFDY